MNKYKISVVLSYILIPFLTLLIIMTFIAGLYRARKNTYSVSDDFFKDLFYAYTQSITRNMIFNDSSDIKVNNGENRIIYVNPERVAQIKNFQFAIYYKDLVITNVLLDDNHITKESIENVITENKNTSDNIKTYRLKDGKIETDCDTLNATATEVSDRFVFEYYKIIENVDSNAEYPVDQSEKVITNISDFEIYATFDEDIKNYFYEMYNKVSFLGENCEAICIIGALAIIVLLYFICVNTGKNEEGILDIKLNSFDKRIFELVIIFEAILITGGCVLLVRFCDNFDFRNENDYTLLLSSVAVFYTGFILGFNTIIKRIKTHTFIKNSICYRLIKNIIEIIKIVKKYIDNNYSKSTSRLIFGFALACFLLYLISSFGSIGIILTILIVVGLILEMAKKSNDIQDEAISTKVNNERLKAELITNVSHDIKTPLTSIINYIDLLKKENLDNEKAKEYIKVLDEKSQRLKKLTEDLIEVSKASSGNLKLNNEPIDINQLINQALGEFEDKFKNKKLKIEKNFTNNKVFVSLDNRYIYRIVENIFSNIEKYALESTRVYIDIIEEDDKVLLSFKNTSKEKLNISEQELMQRFVRGDKSRTEEGSGLGLAIISSLTEAMNGKYDLKIDGDLFKITISFKK